MRALLDTHCWLWLQTSPEKLSEGTLEALSDPESELFLSAASSWEIAIKWSLGKLEVPLPPTEYIPSRLERQNVQGLAVHHRHALHVGTLPRHHRDPFDRLLLAQSQLERLTFVTADRHLEAYDGTEFLWA